MKEDELKVVVIAENHDKAALKAKDKCITCDFLDDRFDGGLTRQICRLRPPFQYVNFETDWCSEHSEGRNHGTRSKSTKKSTNKSQSKKDS